MICGRYLSRWQITICHLAYAFFLSELEGTGEWRLCTSKMPLVCTFEPFELESDLPECCRSLISAFETLSTLVQLIRENEILNLNR